MGGIVSNAEYVAVITAGPDRDLEPDQLANQAPHDLMHARDAITAALPKYEKAAAFYDGEIGDIFASQAVRRLLANSGADEVEDFNYAAVPVDVVADRLQIMNVTAARRDEDLREETTGGSDNSTPTGSADADGVDALVEHADHLIADLQTRNQLRAEADGLHLQVSEFGDSYLFVWPVTEHSDDIDEADPEAGEYADGRVLAVDMIVNDPRGVRIIYDPHNPLRKAYSAKYWCEPDPRPDHGGDRHRMTLTYPEDDPGGARVERWVTRVAGSPDRATDWAPYRGEDGTHDWPLPNPTGVVPYFHFRNHRPYGLPEHLRAYGPQRMVNKLIGAHAVTVDYQSFPQRYALTDPKADQVLSNRIDPDFPDDDGDDPENPGNHSVLRADPAAVWRIPGVTSMGQFDPADPSVFITPMDRYIRAVAELTSTPLHRFGSGFSQPPTGESLRVAEAPTNKKIDDRQMAYGEEWSNAYEFALHLLGVEGIKVTIGWRPAESATSTDDWTVLGLKIANGVPVRQALIEAAYSEQQVDEWMKDESGADLVRRVALLNSIGTAVQTLGAGVGLGVVSEAQVGDIIARVLGLTAAELPPLEQPVEIHAQPAPGAAPPAGPPPPQQQQNGQQNGNGRASAGQPAMPALPAPPAPAPKIKVGTDG